MIYNFNLGIGWASSGVEYAQSYRAAMLRNIHADAKFVFTDMFPVENIEHMTRNIGFLDSEIIWLYTFFTDFKTAPVSFTRHDLEATFSDRKFTFSRNGKKGRYTFRNGSLFYTVYFTTETSELVHRVEMVSEGLLIRKDYFTYGRVYSEYYAPLDNKAHMYLRRFYNTDGSVAYEEINDDDDVMYQFPDRFLYSKEELVGYMVSRLNLTRDDIVIIDRMTGIGQAIIMNAGEARIVSVIHADHFSEESTNDDYILWNNYYEYDFRMHKHIAFYVAATEHQRQLVISQFEHYLGVTPVVHTIPVGSLKKLCYPTAGRQPFSVITAARLATEKHIDWVIKAVIKARESVPGLTLDIYGEGGEKDKLRKLIQDNNAQNYITLCGQQDLREVYQNYEVYLSGSTSEGFGLTLMEAVGAGLPIIGFDVRYGNQTFIDHGKNGYLIDVKENNTEKKKVDALADRLVELFMNADLDAFHERSYEIARTYLTEEVEKRWAAVVK